MLRISAATRISIALACLTLSIFFVARSIGMFPDGEKELLEDRKALCESLAVQCCLAAQRNDVEMMRALLQTMVSRNDMILSAGVRRAEGDLMVDVGNHAVSWRKDNQPTSDHVQVAVPIYQRKQIWGHVELCFTPLGDSTWWGWWKTPVVRLTFFVACGAFLVFTFYLRRVLQHLDPSAVIPDRVRATLDTLAEGVLVLDRHERIVLANQAFARNTGCDALALQGTRARDIAFLDHNTSAAPQTLPWHKAIREGLTQTGIMLGLKASDTETRTFVVNSTPILGADGKQRGALATFDDVTGVERKNKQLEEMLQVIELSRDEIRRQNDELTILATRDSLTGCLNRRAFYAQFEKLWQAARSAGTPISTVMVDADHFKRVNDNYGHGVGDQVLQALAAVMKRVARAQDLVCRYGGEEFCLVLPETDLAQVAAMAEQLRKEIAGERCAGLDITVSVGVSASSLGAGEAKELLDQADTSLYASKRNGRNCVTSWDKVPPDFHIRSDKNRDSGPREPVQEDPIPFPAVAALVSALAYRDVYTAEHSRRVADYCLAAAHGLLAERDCYVLEVAAMLHDIGKLGVPDSILLKPGRLTEEEWQVMRAHDQMGADILATAFSDADLAAIVRTHYSKFGGGNDEPELPIGEDIPVGARILAIADAYDAMVSDRVYRPGCGREKACAELRRCGGKQFDPALVERFIEATEHLPQHRDVVLVPKQTALRIGVQIEQLAKALDARDFGRLAAAARHVAATASNDGLKPLVDVAARLQRSAMQDPDLLAIVGLTTELLEMCRSTQSVYLEAQGVARREFAGEVRGIGRSRS